MSKNDKERLYMIVAAAISIVAIVAMRKSLVPLLVLIPRLASWALRGRMSEGGVAMNVIRWHC